MAQLPLELGFPPRYGSEDFIVAASNSDVNATLARWPDWSDYAAVLVGPEGSGKTHLASVWANRSGARWYGGDSLTDVDPTALGESNAVIDDADRVGGAEAVLFHILNLGRESGHSLLLTAQHPPDLWELRVADLLSRLRLAPLLRLEAPSDDLIRAVLVKLFVDRQLTVDPSVIDYLALRMDRSLGTARRLVEALDRISLAAGRRITRMIAAEALAGVLDQPDE